MRKINLTIVLMLVNLFSPFYLQGCSKDNIIKEPEFAGKFYPADQKKLKNALDFFFSKAINSIGEKPFAIIAPHAGYIFSGQIAADAYNQARNYKYDYIIVLGTNHTTAGFSGVSVYSEEGYKTPLGKIKIDRESANALKKADKDIVTNEDVNSREHSIEVQLPFIQYCFPDAKIIPMVVSARNTAVCERLGSAISKVFSNKSVLVVASSDLSHYPEFSNAEGVDKKTLTCIKSLNTAEIAKLMDDWHLEKIPQLSTCACGAAPILSAVFAAKEMGADKGTIVSYYNSGNTTFGDLQKVVGYGAVIITKNKNISHDITDPFNENLKLAYDNSESISDNAKKYLLTFARETVEQYLKSEITPVARNAGNEILFKRGAFVTLKKNGELRGCIGRMDSEQPLYKVIGSMAVEAAFNDNRFDAVKFDELKNIEFEISILTPFKRVPNADYITMKKDGVLIKKNGRQAVFLPQVAEETGWSKEVFLDQLCRKAGLYAGDWKDAEIYTFRADVFKESDFNLKKRN